MISKNRIEGVKKSKWSCVREDGRDLTMEWKANKEKQRRNRGGGPPGKREWKKKTGDSHGNRYGVGKKYAPGAREDPRSKIKSHPLIEGREKKYSRGGGKRTKETKTH